MSERSLFEAIRELVKGLRAEHIEDGTNPTEILDDIERFLEDWADRMEMRHR